MSRQQRTQPRNGGRGKERPQSSKARAWAIVAGVIGVAIVSLLAVTSLSGDPDVSVSPGADASTRLRGEAAPGSSTSTSARPSAAADVAMVDFDGNLVTIAEFEGKPLVVNFWASWCAPCLTEMPGFERVYQKHRQAVQFLGVNLADDVVPALRVVEETGITYPLARDIQGEAFAAFGGFGMPTTVFLDENGAVIELYTGGLTADELEARIVEYFES